MNLTLVVPTPIFDLFQKALESALRNRVTIPCRGGTGTASGRADASSHGTGQEASSEEVEGAKRDRLSNRFCMEEQA